MPKRHLPFSLDVSGARKVLRQEHKFSITQIQFRQHSASVSIVMNTDKNNGRDGYMVRSLYFDTLNDYDYWTKIDGVDSRRKIRLRIYNTDSAFAQLEMKQKQSIYQLKRSIKIKREDAIMLSEGQYTPLLCYDDPFAVECYTLLSTRGYVPKTIVQYQRLAFVGKGEDIRITFDHELKASESCFDLFSDKLCLYPIKDSFNAVLEVKYNGFLFSYIKELLQRFEKSPVASSKYCMARTVTLGTYI